MQKETEKEIGKWFMDIAKYTATAALISSFLGGFEQMYMLYVFGLVFVLIFFFVGVAILNKK